MVKPGRIPCCIIGCRRTAPADRYPENTEIICGKCFRLAPRHIRQRLRRLMRICRKLGVTGYHDSKPGTAGRKAIVLTNLAWNRMKKVVTDRKVGIA
jgi:hypothetical protein